MSDDGLLTRRPAEIGSGAAGTVAAAIIIAFQIPDRFTALLTLAVGWVASAITWWVARRG